MGGADGWLSGVLVEWSHATDRGVVRLDDGRRLPVSGIGIGGLSVTPYPGLAVIVKVSADGLRVLALAEAFEAPKPAA